MRAADLQKAFSDPEVDVVQTMRGGYGSAQVIPLLDFDAIATTPKAFFGFSDITAMHAALLARAGMVTFYGPSLTMFGNPSPSEFTTERFLNVLGGETTGPVPKDSDRLTVVSIAGGKASGRLVGGCLLDFIFTIGTSWEPDLDGAIFFFEDSGSAPIQIDRALLYLHQIGKLDNVRGIVVGELAGSEWDNFTTAPRSKTLEDVLTGRLGGLGVPVLYNLPLGHGASLATLPLGVQATVDADAKTLTIDEPHFFPIRRKFLGADRLFLTGGAFPAWLLKPARGPGRTLHENSSLRFAPMARRGLLVLLGTAVAAAAVAAVLGRARKRGAPETNGGRERTEELRREIEAARARLRESIRSQDG